MSMLSADPIKIVLNVVEDSSDGRVKCMTSAPISLRFSDDPLNVLDDDIYEVDTVCGSRESSRPSLSSSLVSSRPSFLENHVMDDDALSHVSDETGDEVHLRERHSRNMLCGAMLPPHLQGWQYQKTPTYAPSLPYFSTNPTEDDALGLEIAAAELKVAALRAEMAAKRVRAGNNGIALSPPVADQASTCEFAMLSTAPRAPAPQSSRQAQHMNSIGGAWNQDSASYGSTTVMLRNVPNNYTRDMVVELLESLGFAKGSCFDFIYVPFDLKRCSGLGYAFVNFSTEDNAVRAMRCLSGFTSWKVRSRKILQVSWTYSFQGLAANIERYRNSPVMHPDVPERFKPSLYKDGCSIAFPPPTKALSKPAFA